MKRFISWVLVGACCISLAACGSDTTATTESSDASTEASAEATESADATMTDAEGNEIALTESDDYAIAGTYICSADGSVWAFGGEQQSLGVAYLNEEDGDLGCYICGLTFYTTEEDEDGNIYLVLQVENETSGDQSYWYVTNLIDDDEEVIGLRLAKPDDEDTYVTLYTEEYYEENAESGDAE